MLLLMFAKVMFSQVSVCPQGGHLWWGACVAGGMCKRGHAWPGGICAWHGACMAGETATVAGDTHPTGMHSCFLTGRVLLQHL